MHSSLNDNVSSLSALSHNELDLSKNINGCGSWGAADYCSLSPTMNLYVSWVNSCCGLMIYIKLDPCWCELLIQWLLEPNFLSQKFILTLFSDGLIVSLHFRSVSTLGTERVSWLVPVWGDGLSADPVSTAGRDRFLPDVLTQRTVGQLLFHTYMTPFPLSVKTFLYEYNNLMLIIGK